MQQRPDPSDVARIGRIPEFRVREILRSSQKSSQRSSPCAVQGVHSSLGRTGVRSKPTHGNDRKRSTRNRRTVAFTDEGFDYVDGEARRLGIPFSAAFTVVFDRFLALLKSRVP